MIVWSIWLGIVLLRSDPVKVESPAFQSLKSIQSAQ